MKTTNSLLFGQNVTTQQISMRGAEAKRNPRQVSKSNESLQSDRNKAPVARVVDTKFVTGLALKSPPPPADLLVAVQPFIESDPRGSRTPFPG